MMMECAITKEEYNEVASSMSNQEAPQPKKRATQNKKAKEPEAEDARELREAIALKQTAGRKLKQVFERVRKDITESTALVPNVEKKGYPAEMCGHLYKQLNAGLVEVSNAAKFYATEVIKADGDDIAKVNEARQAFEQATHELDTLAASLKKGVFSDVKKLGMM